MKQLFVLPTILAVYVAGMPACLAILLALACQVTCRQWQADTGHACLHTGHLVDRQGMEGRDWTCSFVQWNRSDSFQSQLGHRQGRLQVTAKQRLLLMVMVIHSDRDGAFCHLGNKIVTPRST